MTRSKAEREQDRADLLAVLEDAGVPLTTQVVICRAQGLTDDADDRLWWPHYQQGYADLRALERASRVEWLSTNGVTGTRWSLPPTAGLTQRERDEDEYDIARQMAGWEPAGGEETDVIAHPSQPTPHVQLRRERIVEVLGRADHPLPTAAVAAAVGASYASVYADLRHLSGSHLLPYADQVDPVNVPGFPVIWHPWFNAIRSGLVTWELTEDAKAAVLTTPDTEETR